MTNARLPRMPFLDGQEEHELDDMTPNSPGIPQANQQGQGTTRQEGPPPPHPANTLNSPQAPAFFGRTSRPTPRRNLHRYFCVLLWRVLPIVGLILALLGCLYMGYWLWRDVVNHESTSGNNAHERGPSIPLSSSTSSIAPFLPNKRILAKPFADPHQQQIAQTEMFTEHQRATSNVEASELSTFQSTDRNDESQTASTLVPGLYVELPPGTIKQGHSVSWSLVDLPEPPKYTPTNTPFVDIALHQESPKTDLHLTEPKGEGAYLYSNSKANRPDLDAQSLDDIGNAATADEKAAATLVFHWVVEILYAIYRRNMQIPRGWCIGNACSEDSTLNNMCSGAIRRSGFQRQECEWCWDNLTKEVYHDKLRIGAHCDEISKRSLIGLLIISGLFIVSVITFMAVLAVRKIRSIRKTKAIHNLGIWKTVGGREEIVASIQHCSDRAPGRRPWYHSEAHNPLFTENAEAPDRPKKRFNLQKKGRRLLQETKPMDTTAKKGKVLIMPPAVPHALDGVFSNIHNTGHGRLLPDGNNQEDSLGFARTSSGRC